MIHFSCPRCNKIMAARDESAGAKVACPKCQQRLIVPPPPAPPLPPPSKTVLGTPIQQPGLTAGAPPQAIPSRPEPPPMPSLERKEPPLRKAEKDDDDNDYQPRRRRSKAEDVYEDDDYVRPRRRRIKAEEVDKDDDDDYRPQRRRKQDRPQLLGTELSTLSISLVLFGLAVIVYFFGFYDTTVPLDPELYNMGVDKRRVYNIGLMQTRTLGAIGGFVSLVAGIAMAVIGYYSGEGSGQVVKHRRTQKPWT